MVHRGLDAIPVGGECAVMGQVWGPTLMYDLENICLKTSRRWTQITRPLCGCWKSTLHRRWCKLLGGTWRGVKVKERNLLPRRPHWLIAPWKSCGVQRLQRLFWVSSLMSVSLEQHTKTMKDCEINCHLMQGFFFPFFFPVLPKIYDLSSLTRLLTTPIETFNCSQKIRFPEGQEKHEPQLQHPLMIKVRVTRE